MLYLDDDTAEGRLARMLEKAGHDAQVPADVNLSGESDPVHLAHAVRQGRVMLTKNHDDYKELHELCQAFRGHHPGIVVIRQDNDRKRDMKPNEIVRALNKLLSSGIATQDGLHILNHWR